MPVGAGVMIRESDYARVIVDEYEFEPMENTYFSAIRHRECRN
jgi:hypothetical protein